MFVYDLSGAAETHRRCHCALPLFGAWPLGECADDLTPIRRDMRARREGSDNAARRSAAHAQMRYRVFSAARLQSDWYKIVNTRYVWKHATTYPICETVSSTYLVCSFSQFLSADKMMNKNKEQMIYLFLFLILLNCNDRKQINMFLGNIVCVNFTLSLYFAFTILSHHFEKILVLGSENLR